MSTAEVDIVFGVKRIVGILCTTGCLLSVEETFFGHKPHAEAVECRHIQKIDECRWALVLNRMRCGKFAPLTYFGF